MEETTAEYAVQELVRTTELRIRPHVSIGAKTDIGRVRDNNEDKFEFFVPSTDEETASRGLLFVVCDGMGGHEAGQIASELATKTFIDVYRNHPTEDPAEAARSAVQAANRFVLDVARAVPSRKGMGTTMSVLLLVQEQAIVVQVGDSRVYRLRADVLEPLTRDHTWVEETIAAGIMPREQAENHPYKHVLTRAVGTEPDVNCDVFTFDSFEGDRYLLCSDGVTNHVNNESIKTALESLGPAEAAWNIVSSALAGGGSDNATAIVVKVDRLEKVV